MNRPTACTTPIVALALCSLLWLSSLAPALAATVTDTFQLKLTGTERCRNDSKFVETIHVKTTDGVTLTLKRDVLNAGDLTDIQATINTHGDNATIDAITLNGRALPANKSGSTAQLVLSGRDPGNPDRFFTLRGTATFNQADKLTNVTGTYVYQVLSNSGGIPNSDCLGSGTFVTGTGLPPWAQAALEAYLKASNTGAQYNFGGSGSTIYGGILANVALDGNTLAVGSVNESSAATGVNGDQTNNSAPFSGAVYVFRRTGGVWRQQAYVKASNTGVTDFFWSSVALAGDTLAVGALGEDNAATGVNGDQADNSAVNSGAVYVYRTP